MTSKRSNQRNAFGRQSEDKGNARPASRKLEGRRSANEVGDTAINRPKAGKAPSPRNKKNAKSDKD